jgi:LPXTG-motif cell wall-anchored protein
MLSKHAFSRVAAAGAAVALIIVGGVTPASAAHDNTHGKTPEHAEANHAAAEQKAEQARSGSDNAGGDNARPEQKPAAAGRDGAATPSDKRARPQAATSKRPGKPGAKPNAAQAHSNGNQGKGNHGKGPQGKANPPKHDPVTVCHLLGNGSYIELTFDDSALDAHLAHGDLREVPENGCPAAAEDAATSGSPSNGHTPVTVCHVLGNGSYHELTFDDSALKAHIAHGDLHPVPAAGCPGEEDPTSGPGAALPGTEDGGVDTDGTQALADEVAGVSEEATPERVAPAEDVAVLGVEQEATANRAPATLAPSAGFLPQTGAGQVAMFVVAGLGALAAGAALLSRRRVRATR